MSMPIEYERRQFLRYFLYLCWDRPILSWCGFAFAPFERRSVEIANPGRGAGCSARWKVPASAGTGPLMLTDPLIDFITGHAVEMGTSYCAPMSVRFKVRETISVRRARLVLTSLEFIDMKQVVGYQQTNRTSDAVAGNTCVLFDRVVVHMGNIGGVISARYYSIVEL